MRAFFWRYGWWWWETYCVVDYPLNGHQDLERYRHVVRVIDVSLRVNIEEERLRLRLRMMSIHLGYFPSGFSVIKTIMYSKE